MAAATFDATNQIPQGHQQHSRRVEYHYRVDFNTHGDGTGLAATESMAIGMLPAGYVHERLDPVLRTAEGTAATLDVGTEADVDCFGDGLNMNGTANARIALAGTEAATPGTYHHTATEIRVLTPSGAATLDDAIVDLTFVGYLRPTT
jgi:hypothetical protein